jgi:hypothetical protein
MATDHDMTPDEQVYQDNKREPEIKVVYSNDPTDAQTNDHSSDSVTAADQDKAVADTFPASDPLPTSAALPSKPQVDSEQSGS